MPDDAQTVVVSSDADTTSDVGGGSVDDTQVMQPVYIVGKETGVDQDIVSKLDDLVNDVNSVQQPLSVDGTSETFLETHWDDLMRVQVNTYVCGVIIIALLSVICGVGLAQILTHKWF